MDQLVIIKKLMLLLAAISSLLGLSTSPKLGAEKPLTDYKFWYIKRCDDVHICEAAIRFYEGAVTTQDEKDGKGNLIPVTRYRRTKRLTRVEVLHIPERFIKEANGNDAKLYTDKDFGVISTDDELRAFLNKELVKDPNRMPILQQQ